MVLAMPVILSSIEIIDIFILYLLLQVSQNNVYTHDNFRIMLIIRYAARLCCLMAY